MPCLSSVCSWLASPSHKDFLEQYTRAREVQAELLADEIVDIADDNSRDAVSNSGAIERSKIKIDARKWVASKLLPKKYGNQQQVNIDGGVNITWKEERTYEADDKAD
ncbi:hypothetical protein GCM10027189_03980 [Rufibacter soli]